jgi:hypothetical protein
MPFSLAPNHVENRLEPAPFGSLDFAGAKG